MFWAFLLDLLPYPLNDVFNIGMFHVQIDKRNIFVITFSKLSSFLLARFCSVVQPKLGLLLILSASIPKLPAGTLSMSDDVMAIEFAFRDIKVNLYSIGLYTI